jgi:hypothetical protein
LVTAVHIDAGSYEETKKFVIDLFSEPAIKSSKNRVFEENLGLDEIQ